MEYRILPNYRTMCLGFSKALGKLVLKYHLVRAQFKESSTEDFLRSVFNDAYAILFSIFCIETYVVGTHLNSLDLSRQFI